MANFRRIGCIALAIFGIVLISYFGEISCKRIRSCYGETCDNKNRCESKQSLTCRNGICECLMAESMIFDKPKNTCVVKSGGKCSYTALEAQTVDENEKNPEKMFKETLSCVSNAECFSSGLCGCISTFKESENGTCQPKFMYGDRCNANSDCREDLNLICENGQCLCNSTYSIYDEERDKCISRAGAMCELVQDCPLNSRCDYRTVENTRSSFRRCICSEDYFVFNETGTCEPKRHYGEECDADSFCDEKLDLSCENGFCKCNKSNSIYDEDKQKCLILAGKLCVDSYRRAANNYFGAKPCTNDSICERFGYQIYDTSSTPSGHYYQHKCNCKADAYYETPDRTCSLKGNHGEKCEIDKHCMETSGLICGEMGTCQCNQTSSIYDIRSKKCLIRAGFSCVDSSKRKKNIVGWLPCIEKATCEPEPNSVEEDENRFIIGIPSHFHQYNCQCGNDAFQTFNGTCQMKRNYEDECENDNECKQIGKYPFLCISGKCQCGGGGIVYDPIWMRCVRKFNETCERDGHFPIECVYPDICEFGRCVCSDFLGERNYFPTNNGFCHSGERNDCGEGNLPPCSAKRGLVCLNKKCQCRFREHQYFSRELKTCVSLVRGPCGNSSNVCVSNSECLEVEGAKECRCKKGFVPVDRKCELAYGQHCDYQSLPCDQSGGLSCINGACQCEGYQFFKEEEQRCKGLVGAVCDLDKENFCVDGATCKQFRSKNRSNKGVCVCMEGYSRKKGRTCDILRVIVSEVQNKTEAFDLNIMPKDEGCQKNDII